MNTLPYYKTWKENNPGKGFYDYVEALQFELMECIPQQGELADREEIDILALSEAYKKMSQWILGDLQDNAVNG